MDTDDSKLSKLLKNHESAYIDDGGFTGRIMAALPPPRRDSAILRRPLLLASSCLLSIILTLLLAGQDLLTSFSDFIQLTTSKPVLQLSGLGFGVLPLACFIASVGIACLLGYRFLREPLR